MHALTLLIAAGLVFAVGYRYYSAFLAAKVLALDPDLPTPAVVHNDGQNYVPTNRWMLLGHHFAAISGAGPLIGPVLAAQFGYLPGYLWLLVGAVVAGATHDMIVLYASTRHDGQSLLGVARREIGPFSGWLCSVFVLFLLVIAMAGASIAIVNALYRSPWGVFTVGATVPISILAGVYLRYLRPGRIGEATVMGVGLILAAVVGGSVIPATALGRVLDMSREELSIAIPFYSFLAAGLPVWLLLLPRDYLSSYIKVGTMLLLVAGMVIANPVLQMPPVTQFVHGNGPVIPGKVWPFLFITVSCGAISGYHSIVCCGTTPKMVQSERDIRPIGYGSMLIEGIVAMTALVAVTVLPVGDFFAISTPPEVFTTLGMPVRDLQEMSAQVGEELAGRPGGAASLAAGMARIFSGMGGGARLMSFWYHFAIAFQALFILTLVDAGTRAGRYLLHEVGGRLWRPLGDATWLPGVAVTSAVVCAGWGYLLYGGSISKIWPLFGVNNQILGCIALAIGTTMLVRAGKARYAPTTALAMAFLFVTAFAAGYQNVVDNYLPAGDWLLAGLSIVLMAIGLAIVADAVRNCIKLLRRAPETAAAERIA